MAHFAELDENNVVLRVIVVSNADITDDQGVEREELGVAFCQALLGANTRWVQTSYNANFRVRYAGSDFTYDQARDAFIPPKPYPSWILNESTLDWAAPVPYPNDGVAYYWDETTGAWVAYEDQA